MTNAIDALFSGQAGATAAEAGATPEVMDWAQLKAQGLQTQMEMPDIKVSSLIEAAPYIMRVEEAAVADGVQVNGVWLPRSVRVKVQLVAQISPLKTIDRAFTAMFYIRKKDTGAVIPNFQADLNNFMVNAIAARENVEAQTIIQSIKDLMASNDPQDRAKVGLDALLASTIGGHVLAPMAIRVDKTGERPPQNQINFSQVKTVNEEQLAGVQNLIADAEVKAEAAESAGVEAAAE